MDAKLKDVAKVILRDRFDEFVRRSEAFQEDPTSIDDDKELSRLVGVEEAAEEGEERQPDEFLWAFAAAKRCVGWIDWKGEEDERELQGLVDQQLAKLGKKMDWRFLDEFEKGIDETKLRSGDYIAKKFTAVDQELRKQGVLLAMLQQGDDQYYPFVATTEEFKKIDGAEIGMSTVEAWVDI